MDCRQQQEEEQQEQQEQQRRNEDGEEERKVSYKRPKMTNSTDINSSQDEVSNDSDVVEISYVEFYSGIGGWTMALEEAISSFLSYEEENSNNENPNLSSDQHSKNNSISINSNKQNNGNKQKRKIRLRRIAALDHSDLCRWVFHHNFESTNVSTDEACARSATQQNKKQQQKQKLRSKLNNSTVSSSSLSSPSSIERLTVRQVETWNAMIWVMSPPCQPHTRQHLNQSNDMNDPRSKSFLHICTILQGMEQSTLPKLIFIENVIGFESSNSYQQLGMVLQQRNYRLVNFHLNPTQVRIPNDRPRYYGVAILESSLREKDEIFPQSLLRYISSSSLSTTATTPSTSAPTATTTNDNKIQIFTSLMELGVIQTDNDDNILPISEFIVDSKQDTTETETTTTTTSLQVPTKLLKSNSSWCFDIVYPTDKHSACFTHSYGRYIKGTGSILYDDDDDGNDNTLKQEKKKKKKKIELLSPEQREFDKDWTSKIDVTKLRYFSGNEMIRLMGFSNAFSFPENCTIKQQWKLIGNSLNVKVASKVVEFGFKVIKLE